MTVTLDLPEELATEALSRPEMLAEIVRAGLQRQRLKSPLLRDLAAMVQRLAESPESAEVAQMKVSDAGQDRLEELLENNRTGSLTAEDRREWEQFERMEYLVRAAKMVAAAR